jgi:hypothetical protein
LAKTSFLVSIVGAAMAAACGSGSDVPGNPDGGGGDGGGQVTDVSGWYQITADLSGECGMTMPTAPILTGPYAWVERLQNTFYFHVCDGTTEADCGNPTTYDFTQPIANGLRAEGGVAFFSAGCTLTWEKSDLTLVGDQLHLVSFTLQINQDIPQSACTLDAARALTGPCIHESDITATRLP